MDFLYGQIESVAQEFNLIRKGKNYICPFCGDDKSGHLNLSLEKNAFRCPRCDTKGGIIDLYKLLAKCTREEAREAVQSGIGDYKHSIYANIKLPKQAAPLDKDKCHAVYTDLLNMLKLNTADLNSLLARGLDKNVVCENRYKSLPNFVEIADLCNKLENKYGNICNVPGFYVTIKGNIWLNSWWLYRGINGFFVPYRDECGRIISMQIRITGECKIRYVWLSSLCKDNGTAAQDTVHFNIKPDTEYVYLTEGALKADVSAFLSNKSFIAVPGVNSTKALKNALNFLKNSGVKGIVETFDSDKHTNDKVAKAACRVRELITEEGFEALTFDWKYTKGIDDYLLSRSKKRRELYVNN